MQFLKYISIILLAVASCSSCHKEYSCEGCLPPQQEGTAIFYTLTGCINSRPLDLVVNGQTHYLVYASFSVPDCSADEVVKLSLPEGVHHWEANCGQSGTTISGNVNVSAHSCAVVRIL